MADGFMQLAALALPASAVAVALLAGHVFGPGWTRSRLAGGILAVAGTAVGVEGTRLISRWWLILGRQLGLSTFFLSSTGLAAVAVLGGILALLEGIHHARREASGATAALAGLGIVLVPLLPVFLLTGDGVAVIVFDDLAEPTFSRFPGDTATLSAFLVLLGGLVLTHVGGLFSGGGRVRRRLAHAAVGGGVLAVLSGYAWHVARGLSVDTGGSGGSIWPGVNVVPVLLALAAGIVHLRHARAREDPGRETRVAFEVEGADPP